MKRILVMLLAAILLVGCIAPAASAEPAKKKFTVILYLCGSDLESGNMQNPNGGQATRDLGNILSSRYNTNDINIIALAGGSRVWRSGYSTEELTIINVSGRRPQAIATLPLASMGDPDTLSTFINYCYANFPAEQYILDLWDHGGGPVKELCVDRLFNDDGLTTAEIVTALDNSAFKDDPVDLLLMNACLMGSAEISSAVAPYARYMAASQDSYFGFTYDWLAGMEKDPSIVDTAKRLLDSSFVHNGDNIAAQKATEKNSLALIDLSKIAALEKAMNAYFPKVTAQLDKTTFSRMSAQRRNSATFGISESGGYYNYDLVDLGDLVAKTQDTAPAEAKAVLDALDEAVVYLRSANEGCTGLTVYHPFDNKGALDELVAIYNDLDFSQGYTDYMHRFTALLTGEPLAKWANLNTGRVKAEKAIRTLFTMELTEEQSAHYGASQFEALYKHEDGTYTMAYVSTKTELENNALTGEFGGVALYAVGADGTALSPAIDYTLASNGTYVLPVELIDKNEETQETLTYTALVFCGYNPETKKLEPGRVYLWDDSLNGYTGAADMAFTDYSAVKVTIEHRQETRNDEGTLLPFSQWTLVSTESWESAIDDSWSFALLEDTLDTANLYATFQIRDSQNNLYNSEPLVVKTQVAVDGATRITYDDTLVVIEKCTVASNDGQLLMTINVQNPSDKETVYELGNMTINGAAVDASAAIYGAGDNWGLLKDEVQYAMVPVSLAGVSDTVLTSITFDLTCLDAATNETQGVVPVEIILNYDLGSAK